MERKARRSVSRLDGLAVARERIHTPPLRGLAREKLDPAGRRRETEIAEGDLLGAGGEHRALGEPLQGEAGKGR